MRATIESVIVIYFFSSAAENIEHVWMRAQTCIINMKRYIFESAARNKSTKNVIIVTVLSFTWTRFCGRRFFFSFSLRTRDARIVIWLSCGNIVKLAISHVLRDNRQLMFFHFYRCNHCCAPVWIRRGPLSPRRKNVHRMLGTNLRFVRTSFAFLQRAKPTERRKKVKVLRRWLLCAVDDE